MALIGKARREFTARYWADISKTIFGVALASKLFVDLPQWLRIVLPMGGALLFLVSFFIQPKGEER